MIIAIDFDGTIVKHEYPDIGELVPLAKEVINTLIYNGHKCFLYTMRSDKTLIEAKNFCINNGIKLCGWNESPSQFSLSPKQYANIYIDDAALGCPLKMDRAVSNRPYVNWDYILQNWDWNE
jgi:hydroxymethylpyrimidine pyrophosphatase-like HAD family hydrolase